MDKNTLQLIEDASRFSAFYGRALSNHLPMALIALEGLGASPEQVSAFAAGYSRKLEPMPAAECARAAFFEAAIARDGAEAVVRQWADRLLPGIGSAAFHGLIRLAYALESGSRRELALALTHWEASYAELGPLPEPGRLTPAQALASLDARFDKARYAGGNIADRMQRAAKDPQAVQVTAAVGAATEEELASALLSAYRRTRDFTVLHGLTACFAFSLVAPYFQDEALARRYLWQALALAYLSAGGPAMKDAPAAESTLSWEEIRRRAAASKDDHDAKLAYACLRQWQRFGDDRYRSAASETLS